MIDKNFPDIIFIIFLQTNKNPHAIKLRKQHYTINRQTDIGINITQPKTDIHTGNNTVKSRLYAGSSVINWVQ